MKTGYIKANIEQWLKDEAFHTIAGACGDLIREVERLRATLDDIVETPYSMVNDSESLRHTLRQINAEAARSLAKSKS